jgi:hypothetical protein
MKVAVQASPAPLKDWVNTMVDGSFGVKWNGGKVTTPVRATNLLNQEIQQHVFS